MNYVGAAYMPFRVKSSELLAKSGTLYIAPLHQIHHSFRQPIF
jgi:hypothetical protein